MRNIKDTLLKISIYIIILSIGFTLGIYVFIHHSPFVFNDKNENISVNEFDYPTHFTTQNGYKKIATEDGIKNPEALVKKHISQIQSLKIGSIIYHKNKNTIYYNWTTKRVLISEKGSEFYINKNQTIQSRSNNDLSEDNMILLTRTLHIPLNFKEYYNKSYNPYKDQKDSFGRTITVENTIINQIKKYNYSAKKAWLNDEDQSFVKYKVDNPSIDSELIISDKSRIIHYHIRYNDVNIWYNTSSNSKEVFTPKWYIKEK